MMSFFHPLLFEVFHAFIGSMSLSVDITGMFWARRIIKSDRGGESRTVAHGFGMVGDFESNFSFSPAAPGTYLLSFRRLRPGRGCIVHIASTRMDLNTRNPCNT